MKSESRKSTIVNNVGIFSLGLILRVAALSLNLQDRPELNSPSQSYSQISEERYSANQSFIAKSLKYFLQVTFSNVQYELGSAPTTHFYVVFCFVEHDPTRPMVVLVVFLVVFFGLFLFCFFQIKIK